eukprot:CAMPEP_0196139806 /NCGR_PEP_ID=MMETSP0910-20130528/6951_1 /TAXON_ID=49265 /ORGANISM="Thalassiosira rotula, Strain GSO102" /LENGTH=384 /DNA_ID=CAMNT_0041400579 /DNA_START=15 /DNA_END=1169 /DNA_ORIENTATION=-
MTSTSETLDTSTAYPIEVIDPHHHFIDTSSNPTFQSFLKSAVANGNDILSTPEDYHHHVIEPLQTLGIKFVGSVHVEAMPDDGAEEVRWVESMCNGTTATAITNDIGEGGSSSSSSSSLKHGGSRCSYVKAYVASCDLTQPNVEEQLRKIMTASNNKLRGIRWILDCVGPYENGDTATHVGTLRHDGVDYLKSPQFERGLSLLEQQQNLSFDLQCAPIQLVESACALFAKYPKLKVCLDHMGKPRKVLGDDLLEDGIAVNPNVVPNSEELQQWRRGMKAMSQLPNVYVKLSMMGYAIPGWKRTLPRKSLLKSLVREVVSMFGAERCMVAWNWHVNDAISDGDGNSNVGPNAVELLEYFCWCFEGYGEWERERLFAGTAKEFYRL